MLILLLLLVFGLFSFEAQLRYSCEDSRRFQDGLTSRLILCDVNAAWNDSQFTCDCTLLESF